MDILIAGFGNMGRALVAGWLGSSTLDAAITVYDPDAEARDRARALGLDALAPGAAWSGSADVAVLAVKPAAIEAALSELPPARLYLSIAAGRKIPEIERLVGSEAAVVRAMPNTPAAIGFGVTGLCANDKASSEDKKIASELMSAVGVVEWVAEESDMDAVTAVSGSGPAYVFLLIECLTAAAVESGLAPETAERLATATVRGAGAYAAASGLDAASLRRQVTSPNGTTAAALEVLLEGGALEELIRRAVRAAAKRSRELGAAGRG
ncbi:MAG: pyrroline-5-carboxylate reductase [Gammaproteobacteria bacterium]